MLDGYLFSLQKVTRVLKEIKHQDKVGKQEGKKKEKKKGNKEKNRERELFAEVVYEWDFMRVGLFAEGKTGDGGGRDQ